MQTDPSARNLDYLHAIKAGAEAFTSAGAWLGAAKPQTGSIQSAESYASARATYSVPDGIYADSRGVYGYLPTPGSRYASDMYDFSDPIFVARNRQIRADYLNGSDTLESAIDTMRAAGNSSEQIASRVVLQRNSQKIEARTFMLDNEVNALAAGNIKRYGDAVGPTPQQLFERYGD